MYMNKIWTEGPTSPNHQIEVMMYIVYCVYTIERHLQAVIDGIEYILENTINRLIRRTAKTYVSSIEHYLQRPRMCMRVDIVHCHNNRSAQKS